MIDKKKYLRLIYLIVFFIILMLASGCFLIPGIKYEPAILSGGYKLEYYNVKSQEKLILPSEYKGESVTEISLKVLGPLTIGVKIIVIPETYKIIHGHAFEFCKFEEVYVGNSVEEIRENAFSGCRNMTKIYLPDSLTYIGDGAFEYCEDLVIFCSTGSYAEKYAIDNELSYEIYTDSQEKDK